MTSTAPPQTHTIDSIPEPNPQDAGKICKECSRGWPVVLFRQKGADNVLSDTCLRCAKPHREQDIWSKRYASMICFFIFNPEARKIQRARNRMEDDHRQLQQRQTSTVNHRSSSGSSKAHRVLPPSEQPSSSKRSKKNHQHPSSIKNVTSPGGQDEGVSSYTTGTGGSGSGGSVSAHPVKFRKDLAHLAIRLMDEPLRAQAWLKTRYTQAATSALPQKVVYEHYVSSLVQTTHLQLGPNDEADSRFITGRVMSHVPKPLMGVELMGVLTQTFQQVTLNREGFMCVGMRMLSATEERDAEFRLVHTLMSLRAINRHPMGWVPPISTASSGNAQSAASPPMLSGQSSTRTSSPQPHVQPPSHQIPHPSKHEHDSMMPNLKVKPTVSIPLSTTATHFTTQIATSNATSRLDRGSENVEEDRDMYSMFSFAPLAPVDHS